MSTLYIRLPSQATGNGTQAETSLICPYALASDSGAIEREGISGLAALADTIAGAHRIVLLLAAGDVTLLHVKIPPLSASRLKAALPGLVEEQLMSDPSECILVAGSSEDGLRTVAVVQKTWLESIAEIFLSLGAHNIAAIPAQLCLPCQPETVAAVITRHNTGIDLAVRLSEQDGFGLAIMPEQQESVEQEVIQSLCTLVPTSPVALYIPQAEVPTYQAIVDAEELDERITIFADNWPRWIAGARSLPLNMMAEMAGTSGPLLNWRPWRWAIALAAAVLLINVIGLNVEWLRMKREASALRNGMLQIYREAFPKETTIIDPIAQTRQKIVAAQRQSGQLAADDFLALASAFGGAWEVSMQGRTKQGVAAVEYVDRGLLVHLKKDGDAPTLEQIKPLLANHNLSITQQAAGVWQIRSVK